MSRNSEQAAKVRSEMAGILKEEIPMQATPENMQKIAYRFKDRKNFPESFLFYKFVSPNFKYRYIINFIVVLTMLLRLYLIKNTNCKIFLIDLS